MKINNMAGISEEMKQEIISNINQAEDKSAAIEEAIEKVVAVRDENLINSIVAEANRAQNDAEFRKAHGLRSLSQKETAFYNAIKAGPEAFRQSVTADQIDIIPTELVDRTLADIKAESGIFNLITFPPAGVQKWLAGAATGTAVWGGLTDALTSEVNATISALNLDVKKLSAYIVVPKAIRDLEIGYVDKYVSTKLEELLRDGVTAGYLNGDGKTGPIGIMNKIESFKADGTAAAKTKVVVTKLSPKGLAAALKVLTHNGVRKASEVALICNPMDEVEHVNPALYGDSMQGGYVQKAGVPLTVYADANCPQGSAVLTLPGHYTMGFSSFKVDEYKETKALEDADVIVGKVYGDGRADDDDVAVVFDVTKLEEYKFPVENTPKTTA